MKNANKAQKAYNAARMDIWEAGKVRGGKALKKNAKRASNRAIRREAKAIIAGA